MLGAGPCEELLGAAGAAVWEFDAASGLTNVRASDDLNGTFGPAMTIGEGKWYAITHPDDIATISAVWMAVRRGETNHYRCDWRIRGVDGFWHWLRSVGRATQTGADGQPERIAGIYFDISAQKAAEDARLASEAELTAMLETSPHGVLITDADFRTVRWNSAAERLIRQLCGRAPRAGDDATFYSPIGQPLAARTYLERVIDGESVSIEREVNLGAGPVWLEFSARRMPSSATVEPRIVVTVKNVTAHGEIEFARAQAMKLESLGMLTGGVAHDFNNLLTAIIANVELANACCEPNSIISESLDDALVAARRAADAVGYLMDYAGRRTATRALVDCSDMVRETARLLRKSLPASVALVEGPLEETPALVAERTQLQQMLINLIVNAGDAIGEAPGTIGLECRTVTMTPTLRARAVIANASNAEQYVSLVVQDDGHGMDGETLSHIFEPFFTTKPSGHGLGLACVLGAVRANNAMLLLDSVPGRGTRFEVLFPAEPAR